MEVPSGGRTAMTSPAHLGASNAKKCSRDPDSIEHRIVFFLPGHNVSISGGGLDGGYEGLGREHGPLNLFGIILGVQGLYGLKVRKNRVIGYRRVRGKTGTVWDLRIQSAWSRVCF